MNIAYTCNDKQQVCLTYLKINNAYNTLHDPEWVKNASRRTTPSLSIVHNYVSTFTTNKPDPTPCTVIYSLGAVAIFRHDDTELLLLFSALDLSHNIITLRTLDLSITRLQQVVQQQQNSVASYYVVAPHRAQITAQHLND